MNNQSRKIFISTSIPYVNSDPHIGYALELVQADIYARWNLEKGNDVFFAIGTDENSLKNVRAAEYSGQKISDFIKEKSEKFKTLADNLSISYSDFIRTSTDQRHKDGAKKLWLACNPSDIYKQKYEGLYCVGCEEFKLAKELDESGRCPEHPGSDLEKVEEENYFFKLSAYQDKILDLIESNKMLIIPSSRRNEIISFIKSGLKDFSISRSKDRAQNWGLEVPGDDNQIMYVWFDALSNYINILGYAEDSPSFNDWWKKGDSITHIIGKGINRFHTVYWPAMLMSAGLNLPGTVFVHGYITKDGQKISKSLGNTVDPLELVDRYGAEAVRYYLLREIPSYDDGDFSSAKFISRYNGDLANGLGNFTARVLKLYSAYGGELNNSLVDYKTTAAIDGLMSEFKFNEALTVIWNLISVGDKHLNKHKPWETKDKDIIGDVAGLLQEVSRLLIPFLPESAASIQVGLNMKQSLSKPLWPRI